MTSTTETPVLYTPKDIQDIFKCGRKKAYEIIHIEGFPSFRLGASIYVEKGELNKWIARTRNRNACVFKK